MNFILNKLMMFIIVGSRLPSPVLSQCACVTGVRYQYIWKSVYPDSIFDDAEALLQQFVPESRDTFADNVTVSSLLTLADTAASAVIAVTLTAMRKVTLK